MDDNKPSKGSLLTNQFNGMPRVLTITMAAKPLTNWDDPPSVLMPTCSLITAKGIFHITLDIQIPSEKVFDL